MNTFAEVVEKVNTLSVEELEEIKLIIDKYLSDKRRQELEKALLESKQPGKTYNYFVSGEDILSSLNDD